MPTLELPSGLSGEVRRLKVKDENILTDRRASREGSLGSKLIQSVWENIIDPGPYNFEKGFNAQSLLIGDRFDLYRQIRIISYPGEENYEFSVNCDSCSQSFGWEIDLRKLKIKKLSPESFQVVQSGDLFEVLLPDCGKHARFRLLTGKDELSFPRIMKLESHSLASAQLIMQIKEIDGVKDVAHFIKEEMSSYDAHFFRGHSDEVNCGVDTTIGVECQFCYKQMEIDIPFDAGFIFPKSVSGRR